MAGIPLPVTSQVLKRGLAPTLLLALLLLAVTASRTSARDLTVALPYFIVLYTVLFTVGQEAVAARLRAWVGGEVARALVLPGVLVALLYSYGLLGGGNPLTGHGLFLPFLLFFPVLVCLRSRSVPARVDWLDFACVLLYLLPLPYVKLPVDARIPFGGGGFDSATRVVMVVIAVYAFAVIRGLPDVGFTPILRWHHLRITLWVWLALFAVCVAAAIATGFITYVGYPPLSLETVLERARRFVQTFLHTALFEELFFRGLLQNMAARWIHQGGRWRPAWRGGLVTLLPLSLAAGYTLRGSFQWLPAAATLALFATALLLEERQVRAAGTYAGLAIVATGFGLVHYHAGSITFVALAIVAGWAYGYLYLRTANVFYPALAHALINASPMLFGLALVK